MHKTYTQHWLTQDLPEEAKRTLYDIGDVVPVSIDDIIIQAGQPNGYLYLLLDGAFKVYLPRRAGQRTGRTLGHRGPGDLLGEYSFMDEFQPTVQVSASTPGKVLRISHESLRRLLASDAELSAVIYRNLLAYLIVRLRSQDEEIALLQV